MALWKLTIKRSANVNGVRVEKGMSVEYVTQSSSSPLNTNVTMNHPAIANLFMAKYGVDVKKACQINSGCMDCVKIS